MILPTVYRTFAPRHGHSDLLLLVEKMSLLLHIVRLLGQISPETRGYGHSDHEFIAGYFKIILSPKSDKLWVISSNRDCEPKAR